VNNFDEAIKVLEGLTTSESTPEELSDLAATYLARGSRMDDPSDLFRALDRSHRAMRKGAAIPAVVYTAAAIETRLGLNPVASRTWRRLLTIESDPAWRADANEQLRALSSSAAAWEITQPVTLETATAARAWLSKTLLNGRQADLVDARNVAAGVQAATKDPMWSEVVDEMASGRHDVHAYRALAQILEAAAVNDLNARARLAPGTCRQLAGNGSKLTDLCKLELSAVHYFQADYRTTRSILQSISDSARQSGYRHLLGRALVAETTLQIATGDFAAAVTTSEEALLLLSSVGDPDRAASLSSQHADLLNFLGRQHEAKWYRQQAIYWASRSDSVDVQRSVYSSASVYCFNVGLPFAALAFARLPEATLAPIAEVTRQDRILRALTATGDFAAARQTFERIKRDFGALSDPRTRTMRADLEVSEGLLLAAEGRGVEAVDLIVRGVSGMDIVRARQRTDALVWASRIETRLGHYPNALSHLTEAAERIRARTGRDTTAASILDERSWVWDGVSDLTIASGGADFEPLLTMLEHVKSSWESQPWSLARFEEGDHALLYFVATADAIGAWHYRDGRHQFRVLAITPAEVSRLLVELRQRWSSDTEEPQFSGLEALFAGLIEPFAANLRGVEYLHIVPDGILFAVPFPALRDSRSQTFLTEQVELTFSDRLAKRRRTDGLGATNRRPLLIGEPRVASLPKLPSANLEVRRIAEIYDADEATVLMSDAATEAALRLQLKQSTLLHFAGHAIARPDAPDQSGLLLTNGSGRDDDDGILTVSELRAGVSLEGRPLVVLAACRTADAVTTRRYGAANLASEWLAAGAQGVVATVDEIPDSSNALFEQLHYKLQQGHAPAAALRLAQIEAIHNNTMSLSEWARVVFYN
jgi:CHAT domain-containing protein